MREENDMPGAAGQGMNEAIDLAAIAMPVVEGAMEAGDAMADRREDDEDEAKAGNGADAALEHDAQLRLVEALLFAAAEPVTEAAIA